VSQPAAVARVVEAAARKGVALDIVTFDESTRTAADAAKAVGAGVGQIVKSLFSPHALRKLAGALVAPIAENTTEVGTR